MKLKKKCKEKECRQAGKKLRKKVASWESRKNFVRKWPVRIGVLPGKGRRQDWFQLHQKKTGGREQFETACHNYAATSPCMEPMNQYATWGNHRIVAVKCQLMRMFIQKTNSSNHPSSIWSTGRFFSSMNI